MSVMCVSEKMEVNCLKNLMVLFFLRNFCEIKLISPKLAVFCAPKIATSSLVVHPNFFLRRGASDLKLIGPKLAVFCAPKIATISGRPSEFFKTGSIRPAAKKKLHSP